MSILDKNQFGDSAEQPEEQNAFAEPPPEQEERDTIKSVMRPAFAEFIASALFVFIACGCATTTANFTSPGPTVIAIALSFGLTIFILAFSFGHISGGHFNPVISVTFVLLKKISILRGIMFFIAQFFGMLIGILFLRGSTPHFWLDPETGVQVPNCYAINRVSAQSSPGAAFLLEFICSMIFLMVVCAATDNNHSNQIMIPLAIGMAVTVMHLIAVPIDGCSINPTRSFASAAVSNDLEGCGNGFANHWVFWVGPFLGGIAGGFLYTIVFHDGGLKGANLVSVYKNQLGALFKGGQR
jgi:MIP family channel proteins